MRQKKLLLIGFLFLFFQAKAQDETTFDLSQVCKLELKTSNQISASPWGIQFNTFPFHSNTHYEDLNIKDLLEDAPVLIQKVSEMGVKWARVSVDWPSVEDREGEFHFEILDYTLKALKEKSITTYLCFHNGHPVHTSGQQNPMVSEASVKAWLSFIETLVKRYKDEVDYWELWNEPNYPGFWKPEPSPEEYTEMVRISAPVIRENDPDCKVLCGGMARFDVPFLKALFDQGIDEYVDVVQVHPYNEIPEACIMKVARTVKTPEWYHPASNKASDLVELVKNSGKDIEIWQGECGYPSTFNSRGWNGYGPYSENIQAKWILRRGLSDLSYGAAVSSYFVFREQTGIHNTSSFNSKGLMYHDSFDVKKGYHVFQNMCSLMQGKFEVVKKGVPETTIQEDGSFYNSKENNIFSLMLRNDKGEKFFCYWLPVRIQDEVDFGKLDLSLQDEDFSSPLLINLMSGDCYEPVNTERRDGKLILKGLPFADFPFIIVEKKQIN